jgi:enoyl-CoA hydratase/carnithine racemase
MLITERRAGVLVLTLDRPRKRNSLHPELIGRLRTALDEAEADDEVRVVVLTGAGPAFCAGLDLHHLIGLDDAGRVEYMRSAFVLFRRIHDLRQPVLAAVNGPAMAGGFDLAAFCDLRFCATDARFAQTEILLGLTQIMYPVYKVIGLSRAKELAMTGATITAEEAFRIGLADRVFPTAELIRETLRFAQALAANPPRALFDTKRLSREILEMDTASALARMFDTIAARLRSDEHREALESYIERLHRRRSPEGDE